MQKGYRCVNGLILKIIAMAAMLADHMGAILYPEAEVLRVIGRIAFPVFVFLMVEGFYHTGNIRRYELRLLLFAAVSEIPFDLAFSWRVLEFTYQNIFFTLFVSLLAAWGFKEKKWWLFLAGLILLNMVNFDYAMTGLILMLIFYLFRNRPAWGAVVYTLTYLPALHGYMEDPLALKVAGHAVGFEIFALFNSAKRPRFL